MSGDGFADLVGAMSDGSLVIHANATKMTYDGMPYVAETWHYEGSWSTVRELAVGDVTGDGYADSSR